MKTIFVDESGDLGRKERFFVIALINPNNSKRILNFMRKFCVKNTIQEVKGSQIDFSQKQDIINKLGKENDHSISYIVADKNHIEPKLFEDKNVCYNFLFSILIENTIRQTKDNITILLDNHSTKVKSINSLADYIKIKAYTQWGFVNNLHVSYVDSKHSKIIQAVDVAANAIYAKYIYGKEHLYSSLNIIESIKFPLNKFNT